MRMPPHTCLVAAALLWSGGVASVCGTLMPLSGTANIAIQVGEPKQVEDDHGVAAIKGAGEGGEGEEEGTVTASAPEELAW